MATTTLTITTPNYNEIVFTICEGNREQGLYEGDTGRDISFQHQHMLRGIDQKMVASVFAQLSNNVAIEQLVIPPNFKVEKQEEIEII